MKINEGKALAFYNYLLYFVRYTVESIILPARRWKHYLNYVFICNPKSHHLTVSIFNSKLLAGFMHSLFKQTPMSRILQLEVDGVMSNVKVDEILHRHHNMYKVIFENGYENIFYTDVETGKWMEEDLGFTHLAEAIGMEIRNYLRTPFHVPRVLTWHRQMVDGRYVCFGFYSFLNGNQTFYQIYNANRKYQYTLVAMDNDEWQILGNSNCVITHIDRKFIQQVIQILPYYTSKQGDSI